MFVLDVCRWTRVRVNNELLTCQFSASQARPRLADPITDLEEEEQEGSQNTLCQWRDRNEKLMNRKRRAVITS